MTETRKISKDEPEAREKTDDVQLAGKALLELMQESADAASQLGVLNRRLMKAIECIQMPGVIRDVFKDKVPDFKQKHIRVNGDLKDAMKAAADMHEKEKKEG